MNITRRKILAVIILLNAAGLLVAGYFAYFDGPPKNMRVLESYRSYFPEGAICMAEAPECGYCPGEVYEDKCYVTNQEYDHWQ